MKTTIALFILLSISPIIYCQDIIIERESLSKVNADIDTLTGIKNRRIEFRFDTLFFMNTIAVDDYINTRIKNAELINLTNNLIVNMNSSLRGIQDNFGTLSQNIDLNNQIIKKAIEDNNIRINDLANKNTQLNEINLQLSKDLQAASNAIKADKRKRILSHTLAGTGGIAIGVGLGALIISIAK